VTAHAGISTDSTLKVDVAVLFEVTQVGDSQRLGGYTNGEGFRCERGDGETNTVDRDGITIVAVGEKLRARRDGDGQRSATSRVIVVELGDNYKVVSQFA
jgi:hypothetical protein